MPVLNPPISHKELIATLSQTKNSKEIINDQMTPLNKATLKITEKVGTIWFFATIVIWTISWLLWNTLAPEKLRFDPFPAVVLWLFISNMIQIFLMPLLLIGQNLQGQHNEIRAQNDFEINIKAEKEIELILKHLEYQNSLILSIVEGKAHKV